MPDRSGVNWSRRRFLTTAGVVAVGGLAVGAVLNQLEAASGARPGGSDASGSVPSAGPGASAVPGRNPTGARHRFASRPDLSPPVVTLLPSLGEPSAGLVFLTPGNGAGSDGPLIVDNAGQPVWVKADVNGIGASTFRPITHQGRPALVWWEGGNNNGIGIGEFVLADQSYAEIGRVKAVGPSRADHHEFQLTRQGSALIFSDTGVAASRVAGAGSQPWQVLDCAIQEIDLATGRLLFEWHSVDHIGLAESKVDPPATAGLLHDYVHANSIEIDHDGNLLMSARNTSTIYKIDRGTGEILWRLGGKASDFTTNPGAAFSWQHDVRRQPDGSLSVFDDNAAPGTSRAIVLSLDETARTATLLRAYAHSPALLATSEGSVQILPNGNVFVGWGSVPQFSEFTADGRLVFDGSFPAGGISYRDQRFPWIGRPAELPAVAVTADGPGLTVYASWNGATEVVTWQALAGPSAASLAVVGSAPRAGFETAIPVSRSQPFVAARAIDAGGKVLATSHPVRAPA